jgi:hypothetical protein
LTWVVRQTRCPGLRAAAKDFARAARSGGNVYVITKF